MPVRREELDKQYVSAFAAKIRGMYPNLPVGREVAIAEHACAKYSGRVGRSAMAKDLDEKAATLDARQRVRDAVVETLERWRG